MSLCHLCNKWISQPEGKKEKRFCNSTCRSNYWYKKNKKGKAGKPEINILFIKETAESYDGKKTNPIIDEVGQWEKPLRYFEPKPNAVTSQPIFIDYASAQKLMRKFWDEKRELSADEYPDWLEKVDASALSTKQKELVKNSYQ